jgi:hypothetical protein
MGIFDYTLAAGTQFVVFATSDGKIYKDFTTTINTGMTSSATRFFTFLNFGGTLYSFNGLNVVQTWNGSDATTTALAAPPADWTGTAQPSWAVIHSNGNARRIWAGGVGTLPYNVYASGVGTGNFLAVPLSWYIETETGDGIVGAFELGDRLFFMSRHNSYYLNDTSSDTSDWGYVKTIWKGGVYSHRLIVQTPNDVHMMTEDGEIYSFSAVQSYGDYKAASLTRPAYVDKWIKDNVDLTKIAKFHGVYDPVLRAVKWFMVKSGSTNVDMCLPYFIDRPVDKAWGPPHNNTGVACGYDASCSALVRKSIGVYKVYTGNYAGFVWELEHATKNDNAGAYYCKVAFPRWHFDDPRTSKLYSKITYVTDIESEANPTITLTIDDVSTTYGVVTFPYTAGVDVVEGILKIGLIGKRIQATLESFVGTNSVFLSEVLVDHKPMGKKQS